MIVFMHVCKAAVSKIGLGLGSVLLLGYMVRVTFTVSKVSLTDITLAIFSCNRV